MEVTFGWADFIREFDRQSTVEGGKSPNSPLGAAGPSPEPDGDQEDVCGCFDHVGKGECHAHQCTTCRFGCHHEAQTSGIGADRIVPVCEERASPSKPLTIRLNGSKNSIVCHDEQIATTSNGVSEQTQNVTVRKPRSKRAREPEPSTSNGFACNGDVEYVECASRRKPKNTQQTEIEIDSSRKTKTLNGKGPPKGSVFEETQTIDLANLEDIPMIDAKTYGKKTKGRQNKAKHTTEIGVYDNMEEEIAYVGSPRRNGKKRPAKKPISPRMDHKRSQLQDEEDAFRSSEEADVFKYSLTNGTGPSTSTPPKSPLKSPRRNGYTLFNGHKDTEELNHVDSLEKPTPTTSAEPFFQGAFHTKERWRRSSDGGGDGQFFEPVSLTSPAQSLLSPRNRAPIDPLMSPLGEEAEQPKQNGKLNGQRSSFRNAKNPGSAKKPHIFPFQNLVSGNRRESVCSDTLLTPPLPNLEEPTENGTDASILGPLALRPPDTYGFEDINPDLISPTLNILASPGGTWPSNAPIRCSTPLPLDELSLIIPEKKSVTIASPEKRENLLIPLETTPRSTRSSPRKNSVATLFSPNKTLDAEGHLNWVSETELMSHLDQSGLPNIDDLIAFSGMQAEDLNTTMSKPAIPRLVVTPLDTMLSVLTKAVRKKLNNIAAATKPTPIRDLKVILPPLYSHTKLIHQRLKRNWENRVAERAENVVDWTTGRGGKEYKRPMTAFWRMEKPQHEIVYQKTLPTTCILPEGFVGQERKESLDDHHAEKEFLNRMEMQMEQINARREVIKQKSDWKRRNVMYLEQQLPNISTDKAEHEEEANKKFQDIPDVLSKAKEGPYWLPSVKIHDMVTTAIRSRVVRRKKEEIDITFLLKDWNELRISYKSDFRLPREVLVTLSPFSEIAPVIEKKPGGRFRTQMQGQVKLPC